MACIRCYTAFKPFVGDALARVYAAHALCTQAVDAPPDMATSKAPGKDALTQARLVPVRELQKVRKNRASRFSKRRKNFIKKAHELYEDCEVDVFLCVRSRRNNQMWQYSSGFTPPSQTEMANIYPVPITLNPESFEQKEVQMAEGLSHGFKMEANVLQADA